MSRPRSHLPAEDLAPSEESRTESAERELHLIREQVARARAEADLQFLERVFLAAPALVLITRGSDHRVELANPRLRRAFGERRYRDRPTAQVLADLTVAGTPLPELMDQVFASGEILDSPEMTACWERGADGEDDRDEVVFDLLIQPLLTGTGDVSGLSVYMVDVTDHVTARRDAEQKATELARLTRELARTAAELDQFAYVASHDLKAPLRGIANLSQWIEEDLDEAGVQLPEDTTEHLELLRGRVHRMEALIDGLLSYSRAGRVRGDTEPVDVGELVREVVDLLGPPENMTVVAEGPFPTLVTERLPLSQVFHNLIGNAVKFGHSRVEVVAQERPDGWCFAISDDGPGIPREYEHKIWIMFQTLAPRDEIEGTGIGLALVKKLVEAQGGEVGVDSTPGDGATFTFHWPTTDWTQRTAT